MSGSFLIALPQFEIFKGVKAGRKRLYSTWKRLFYL